MTNALIAAPEQGQLVRVRQRNYIVSTVEENSSPDPTKQYSKQHLITLSSIEDDGFGEELQVIWEIEPQAKIIEKVALPEPSGFDSPLLLDAFLDAVRWGASSTADTRSIQSPFRSGIEIEDYQLDPVVRAVQMPRVNLLIADDVGLGKTIEAGMVISELIIRHRARRILIACPAALQVQWKEQMRDKFGLEFRIVDSSLMKQLRRKRGIHVNPWKHFPRLITSVDFLKRERPLRLFKETLPSEGESIYPRRYDVLILDEAHNCAPSGKGNYATDSLRTEAIRLLAKHFEHKLFLTATPHNGYPESFTALLELLDNQRFARGTPTNTTQFDQQLKAVMIRRLKSELALNWDGTRRFAKRVVNPLEVNYSKEEKAIHQALKQYSDFRSKNTKDHVEKFATDFVLKTLKKRLFSSPAAFATTLKQHEKTLFTALKKKPAKPSEKVLKKQLDLIEEEFSIDDEAEEAYNDAVDSATLLFRIPSDNEKNLLKDMKAWAEKAQAKLDTKAKTLIQWLHENIKPGGKWADNRVIIFTEYRATQNWLMTILASEGLTGGDRLLTMYGGMKSEEREAIKAAFQTAPEISPVRIMLATDAASEGIDLQNFCSNLIHYEIPWNPNRMEQRNGRIDRHGQRSDKVNIYHFVGKEYSKRENSGIDARPGDLEADLEFLMRAVRKVEQIREDLGKVGPVIAEQVEDAMLGRRTSLDTSRAEDEAKPIKKLLKFERDLAKQIKELTDQLNETQRSMKLSPENIQKVVEIGLRLAGQPELIPTKVKGIWPDPQKKACPVFQLPALNGSWEACGEGLAHPHTLVIRPIVFDHNLSRGRDDVVLVHLNHRLVQMCLRLLRAEIWSGESRRKLNRITARTVPDNVLQSPAMIAHARLVVIGGDSERLHEEIITAGGLIREGRFARFKTLREMDKALAAATSKEPSKKIKQKLLDLWPKTSGSLQQALEARMKDLTNGLQKTMADRARKESKDIEIILKELKALIEKELDEPESKQMEFWTTPEQEQLDRNTNALKRRILEIPEEIKREKTAVKDRFADPQPRMFPVAVTFLVPEKLAK